MSINARNINATGTVIFRSGSSTLPPGPSFAISATDGYIPYGAFTVSYSGTDIQAAVSWAITEGAYGSNEGTPVGSFVLNGTNLLGSGSTVSPNIDLANSGVIATEWIPLDPEQPQMGSNPVAVGAPGSVETDTSLADVIARLPASGAPEYIPLDPPSNLTFVGSDRRILVTFLTPEPISTLTLDVWQSANAWAGAILYTDMTSSPVTVAFNNDAVMPETITVDPWRRKFFTYTLPETVNVKAILLTANIGAFGPTHDPSGTGTPVPMIESPLGLHGIYADFMPVTSGDIEFGGGTDPRTIDFINVNESIGDFSTYTGVTLSNPAGGTIAAPGSVTITLSPEPPPT